ncbi:hypothetical protein BKA62DRAFT_728189 [Auriculariales sp. MPI-PUGE-AT-0066]|nr:hypothetical protein BKA62DRAFT_728189 [Auriculariales sp. MPI-PUGE-AT-0066]
MPRVNRERAKAPFIAAAVCPRWRSVVINTPALLRYLALPSRDEDTGFGTSYNSTIRYIKNVLKRSKADPIDIFIDYFDCEDNLFEPLHLLGQHADRWRRFALTFALTCVGSTGGLAKALNCGTPQLWSLWLSQQVEKSATGIDRRTDPNLFHNHDQIFPYTPALTAYHLVNLNPSLTASVNHESPIVFLVNLKLHTVTVDTWNHLRNIASRIGRLKLRSDYVHPGAIRTDVKLPYLHQLHIKGKGGDAAFNLPNFSSSPIDDLLLIAHTLSPSYHLLRVVCGTIYLLHFTGTTVGQDKDIPVLTPLCSLRHFTLFRGTLQSTLLGRLSQTGTDQPMWLKL